MMNETTDGDDELFYNIIFFSNILSNNPFLCKTIPFFF